MIKHQFSIENFGVCTIKVDKTQSLEDQLAIYKAESSIVQKGNHYEVSLPWKSDDVKLPDNNPMAIQRLKCLERKLLRDKETAQAYQNEIQKLLDKGYAIQLANADVLKSPKLWYLPHFAVINPRYVVGRKRRFLHISTTTMLSLREICYTAIYPNKEKCLSAVNSIDPLGLMTPVTIKGRILMRDVGNWNRLGRYNQRRPDTNAPNFGGCWERLVGCFKRAIEAVLSVNANPNDETLRTIFMEAEYLVNSRPYVLESDDADDEIGLCPNDICVPQSCAIHSPGKFISHTGEKRVWRISQYLVDAFWKRFIKEYLPTLIHRSKWRQDVDNFKVGEIV
ncbi:hypothetical protein ACLKA6_017256 [Drosophila palustris]